MATQGWKDQVNEKLIQNLYLMQIKVLLALNPTMLFNKINQLDWYRNTLHRWIDLHNFHFEKILEAGCATGSLCNYLDDSGFSPTGIDASSSMIKKAKALNSNIDYQVANILDLPFDNEVFDAVISASLINIVDNKQLAINEMSRVCKKGGIISILVPKQGFTDENLESLSNSLEISHFSKASLKTWHRLAPKMKVEEIQNLLSNAGLETKPPVYYLQNMVFSITAIKT